MDASIASLASSQQPSMYVVEEHNYALNFIYSDIGTKNLYSPELVNERRFTFTTAGLFKSDYTSKEYDNFAKTLNITPPYILDIDLDFFSTDNPTSICDCLLGLFNLLPVENHPDCKIIETMADQHIELYTLFEHLGENNNLKWYSGKKTVIYQKVHDFAVNKLKEAEKTGESVNWWQLHDAGCTSRTEQHPRVGQGSLPRHISTDEQIKQIINNAFTPFLQCLPRPVLITVARSTCIDGQVGFCPPQQVDLIQSLVLEYLQNYMIDPVPFLYYKYFKTNY